MASLFRLIITVSTRSLLLMKLTASFESSTTTSMP